MGNIGYFDTHAFTTGFINAQMMIIRKSTDRINSDYLYKYMTSALIKNQIENISTGSAQPQLTKKDISTFKVLIPPLQEQQKIADILSTVDEQIDNVDRLIKKTKELKKGLMQQLLTKGIGHTEFKETEVGVIPKAWKVKKLEEVTRLITDGSHFSPIGISESEYKICTVMHMKDMELDLENATSITEEDFNSLCKNNCNPYEGDVLLSKDGTVGKVIVYNGQSDKVVLLSSIAIIRSKKEELNENFLGQYLSDERVLAKLTNMKTGSAIKRIVLRDIKNLKVAIPNLEEQKKISDILKSKDEMIGILVQKRQMLSHIKKGLMQQLLTGKIRVKVD